MQRQNRAVGALDPVTFEVLRHRLWAINDEQAMIAARMSGSPIVYEVFDFNSALCMPSGDGLFVGIYNARHAAAMDLVVKAVIERYVDDIRPGDMFMTNDPWAGAVHQNDYAIVAPIFWGQEIILWTGMTMHEEDVGGPVPGNMTVGARDVYGEAPIIPPVKIVKEDQFQEGIEDICLRNSRTPDLMALNFRARIGCQTKTAQRVRELVEKYSKETFLRIQEEIVDHVEAVVRRRFLDLPDGTWREMGYIDHDGNDNIFYPIRLAMTKRGDHMTFDFTGTSKQAPGSINCTRVGLLGGVMSAVLPMICYDVPWTTAALYRVIDIISEDGTINNANHPAPCGMGTIGACWETTNLVTQVIGKMYSCSDYYKKEVHACWSPSSNSLVISGRNQENRPMTALWLGGGAGGGGARSYKDGIDTGGGISSTLAARPNVETGERLYPFIEVYRKQRADTGGAGKFRGGVGAEWLIVPRGNPVPITGIRYTHGVSQPEARGIYGGFPGTVQAQLILRKSNIHELFAQGRVPTGIDDLTYERIETVPAKGMVQFDEGDAWLFFASGGGGYGDPLKRDPQLAARDLRRGLCSFEVVHDIYGVIVDPQTLVVDEQATQARREEIRQLRFSDSQLVKERPAELPLRHGGERICPIGEHIEVVRNGDKSYAYCQECGYNYGPATQDPKLGALMRVASIAEASPLNRYGLVDQVIMQEFFCPGCGTMINVNVQLCDEPLLVETELVLNRSFKEGQSK